MLKFQENGDFYQKFEKIILSQKYLLKKKKIGKSKDSRNFKKTKVFYCITCNKFVKRELRKKRGKHRIQNTNSENFDRYLLNICKNWKIWFNKKVIFIKSLQKITLPQRYLLRKERGKIWKLKGPKQNFKDTKVFYCITCNRFIKQELRKERGKCKKSKVCKNYSNTKIIC